MAPLEVMIWWLDCWNATPLMHIPIVRHVQQTAKPWNPEKKTHVRTWKNERGFSNAAHEVLESKLNWVQLLNQDIQWSDQTTPLKYFLSPPPTLPMSVHVCRWVNILASVWRTKRRSVGVNEERVRFRLRAHDWRPTLPSPGVCWCWQESTVPCSLTERWHRFHLERHTIHMPSHCCISNNLLKPKQTGKRISVSLIEMPFSKPPPIVTTSTLKHHSTRIIGTCTLKYLPVIC